MIVQNRYLFSFLDLEDSTVRDIEVTWMTSQMLIATLPQLNNIQ